jgi:hypothetical protein
LIAVGRVGATIAFNQSWWVLLALLLVVDLSALG